MSGLKLNPRADKEGPSRQAEKVPAFTPFPALCRGANNVGGDAERSLKAENNSSQFDLFHYYVFLNVGVQIQSAGFRCDIFTHGHQCILAPFL